MINLNLQPRFWSSLLLTGLFSFLAPVLLLSSAWLGLYGLEQLLPPCRDLAVGAIDQLQNFLQIFGAGSTWQGLVTLGTAGATVGILFETYALSLSRPLR
jgi:hypothetical protein